MKITESNLRKLIRKELLNEKSSTATTIGGGGGREPSEPGGGEPSEPTSEPKTGDDYDSNADISSLASPDSTKSLGDIDPRLVSKIKTIFTNLKSRGFNPKIVSGFRSPVDHQKNLKSGRSKAKWSFHVSLNKAGKPSSLAADIIDKSVAWGGEDPNTEKHLKAAKFFKALGEEANKVGLKWGGDFKKSNPLWSKHGMGWDPAHVGLSGVSIKDVESQTRRSLAMLNKTNDVIV